MSYDIWLEDESGTEVADWNYTSNCWQMWRAAGADLAEFHGKPAGECARTLVAGISNLLADPAKYRAMNPPNRWGSYDSLVPALVDLFFLMLAHSAATVRVSR
jgi:hypothetical protein